MSTRREFLEGAVSLPLSFFFLPHTIGSLGTEETKDEMISRGGPFSVALLPVDQVNTNDRIYSEEVVQKAIETLGDDPLMGGLAEPPLLNGVLMFKDVAFTATHLRIAHNNEHCRGKWLWGDVRILNTPQGLTMKSVLRQTSLDDYAFRTAGMGGYKSKDGICVVSPDFKLLALTMVPVEEATMVKA
jgi:hypothetical protein